MESITWETMEKNRWRCPEGLEETSFKSLELLKKTLPEDDVNTEVSLSGEVKRHGIFVGFSTYSRDSKGHGTRSHVAYGCGNCRKIYAGPPIFREYSSFGSRSGSDILTFICRGCGAVMHQLYGKTSL